MRRPRSGRTRDRASETRKVSSASPLAGQNLFLKIPAARDEIVPLSTRELPALADQSRFEEVCDREIDIVAAQQDVVAHCLALDFRRRAPSVRAQFK